MAAMRTSAEEFDLCDVEDFLSCEICKEKFVSTRYPRTLHCGHTFCTSCIESLKKDECYPCPTCQSENKSIDGDYLVINLSDLELAEKNAESISCFRCDESRSEVGEYANMKNKEIVSKKEELLRKYKLLNDLQYGIEKSLLNIQLDGQIYSDAGTISTKKDADDLKYRIDELSDTFLRSATKIIDSIDTSIGLIQEFIDTESMDKPQQQLDSRISKNLVIDKHERNNEDKGFIGLESNGQLDKSEDAIETRSETSVEGEENGIDEEIDDKEAILMKVRMLLNKVTPTTRVELTKEFLNYRVSESPFLDDIAAIVYEKAVEEPELCPLYSAICSAQVVWELNETDNISFFRDAILDRAQKTFNIKTMDEFEKTKRSEIDVETDAKKKKEKEIELLEAQAKFRRRKFGNITFIGQLYLKALLSTRIVQFCMSNLLGASQGPIDEAAEESIECAIRLFEMIGKHIQDKENRKREEAKERKVVKLSSAEKTIESWFKTLGGLQDKVSCRVMFMIMNLFVLRRNNWQSIKN